MALEKGVNTRAKILFSRSDEYSWSCGRKTDLREQRRSIPVYVPVSDVVYRNFSRVILKGEDAVCKRIMQC